MPKSTTPPRIEGRNLASLIFPEEEHLQQALIALLQIPLHVRADLTNPANVAFQRDTLEMVIESIRKHISTIEQPVVPTEQLVRAFRDQLKHKP